MSLLPLAIGVVGVGRVVDDVNRRYRKDKGYDQLQCDTPLLEAPPMDIQNNAFKVRIQPIRPPQELFVSLGTRRSRTQDARDSTHVQTSAAAARTLNQHDCCIVRSGAWLFCSNTRGGKNGVVWSFLAGRVCDRPGFAQTPFSCVAEKKASACLVYLLLVGFCCARRGKRFVSVATTRRERVLY